MADGIDKLLYAPITKVEEADDGTVLVYGKVADDTIDLDKQITDLTWLAQALPEWHQGFGNVREMHQASAVGVSKSLDAEDDGFYLGAKIVDPVAVLKVREGVYKGFSIGIKGHVVVADPQARGGRIKGGKIVEVSIVDHPANENTKFVLAKGADIDSALAAQADVEKKDTDPNVGGGVDRDKIPDEDFAGPDRSFPIVKPGDVSDAASSLGRAKGDTDAIKAKIIAIAKRKGDAFVAELPEAWKESKAVEPDITKQGEGDQIGVAAQAIELIRGLIASEAQEDEPQQVSDLRMLVTVLDLLYQFMSNEQYEAAMDTMGLSATADIEKVGAEFSGKNKTFLKNLHDTIVKMAPDVCGKAAEASDGKCEKEADDNVEKQAIIDTVDGYLAEHMPDLVKAAIPDDGKEALAEEVTGLKASVEKLQGEVDEIGKRATPGGPYVGGALPRPQEQEDAKPDPTRAEMTKLAGSDQSAVRANAQEWLRLHPA